MPGTRASGLPCGLDSALGARIPLLLPESPLRLAVWASFYDSRKGAHVVVAILCWSVGEEQ